MVQSLDGETWLPVKGYENLYEVSNLGRVKSLPKKGFCRNSTHLLRQRDNGFGYKICQLMKNGKRRVISTHRLVAIAFIPNPDNKKQVNHKDGNKYNNHYSNLEWCTNSENQLHKFRVLGAKANGGKQKRKILCCGTKTIYPSAYHASRATGINRGNIFNVASDCYGFKTAGGYHWKFVL